MTKKYLWKFLNITFSKTENSKYWSASKQSAKDPLLMPEKIKEKDLCDYMKRCFPWYSYMWAIQMCIDRILFWSFIKNSITQVLDTPPQRNFWEREGKRKNICLLQMFLLIHIGSSYNCVNCWVFFLFAWEFLFYKWQRFGIFILKKVFL